MDKSIKTVKKLLLAGSHAGSTAIAVIEEIKARGLPYEIHWIGRKYAEEGSSIETLEYKNLKKYGVEFHNLNSGKIQTKFTKFTIPALLKIPSGIFQGYKLVKKINPDLILSFGGSSGAVVAICGSLQGVPVLIHEQTSTAGRSNIVSSYFAKKILLSRESSLNFFNKHKSIVTGNPINKEVLRYKPDYNKTRPKTILITGGSRGSVSINEAVLPILPLLLDKYIVFHQTGHGKELNFKHKNYFSFGQIHPNEMIEVIAKSDLVIGRAGANTVSEIIALKKPSILIPIPWTYNDEQLQNAKYLKSLGLAVIIEEKDLTSQKLLSEIDKIAGIYPQLMNVALKIVSPDIRASERVVDLLQSYSEDTQ